MTDLPHRLRELLAENLNRSALSQTALAKFLGVSPSAVSRMLSGDRQISAAELIGIKQFFDISLLDIAAVLDLKITKEQDILLSMDEVRASKTDLVIKPYDIGESNIILPSLFVASAKFDDARYLRWLLVFDDAMSPSIKRGDVVIIDTRARGAVGVYALHIGSDVISMRRLDRAIWDSGDLVVDVTAENVKFRSYTTSLANLKLAGEVVLRISADV